MMAVRLGADPSNPMIGEWVPAWIGALAAVDAMQRMYFGGAELLI